MSPGASRSTSRVLPLRDASQVLGNPAALRDLAAADGYLFVRNLVPRAVARMLRAELLAQCAHRGWLHEHAPVARGIARADAAQRATPEALAALQADVQIRPAFGALRTDPGLLALLGSVLDAPPVAGCGDVCRLAFPNAPERATPAHQDHFYTRGATDMWTAWIPLGDCPPALGGLAVIPGSHAGGLLPHVLGEGHARSIAVNDDSPWACASYRCGDVLLFNALTVHRARPNVTPDRIRVSADYRYRPAMAAFTTSE